MTTQVRLLRGRVFSVYVAPFFLAALLLGCSSAPKPTVLKKPDHVAAFSTSQLGEPHPLEWQPWLFSRFNRRTDYRVLDLDGKRVLEAHAKTAASGILQEVDIDPVVSRHIKWSWKVPQLLPEADLTRKGSDDSPARLIVTFEGDIAKLDVEDRAMAGLVKMASGREMPYATLMYVWDNKLPVGTFLESPHSPRVKLIVVASGAERLGVWNSYSRNLLMDYKRAFGEAPGKITTVGLMTDTNATETNAVAYYGDIVISGEN